MKGTVDELVTNSKITNTWQFTGESEILRIVTTLEQID
jgi:hypothetical protein